LWTTMMAGEGVAVLELLHKSEYAWSETHRRIDVWTLMTLSWETQVRLLRSSPPSGSHLSLSPEHPGGPRPPRCVCRLSPQGGPRMGPALSPPSPCCMCLRIGRPRGSCRAKPCEGPSPPLYGRPSPSLHNRLQTGCGPRGAFAGRERPVSANDTCVGLVARPVRWPSVFEASRWG
jgi:hypothetical protein